MEARDSDVTDILKRAQLRNEERRLHVERVCRRYNLGKYKTDGRPSAFKEPPAPQYEVFYYDLKHRLSWCPIYKAASSTWLYNLALLQGSTEQQLADSNLQISEFVRHLLPPLTSWQAKTVLARSLKFVVVRHPFERILSAYRDKLESLARNNSIFYYRKYGRKIVSKYRSGGSGTRVASLVKPKQRWWSDDAQPVGVEPTFKEFVRYLIDSDLATRADDHWIPFHLFCTPCWITYDIIAKVETMLQDQLLILHAGGLHDRISPSWRHKTNPFSAAMNNVENEVSRVAKIYFSQLNATDVRQLYQKYELDFELFEYEATDYYEYVAASV